MNKQQFLENIKVAFNFVIVIVLILAFWYFYFHLPRLEKAKYAQDAAEKVALEEKVSSNFDNYLRAAPILKGRTEDAFDYIVNKKIRELNIPEFNDTGMNSAQKWREAERIKFESDALIAETKQIILTETRECSTMFDIEKCQEMVESWHCIYGDYCTDNANEIIEEEAFNRDYISLDNLNESCEDNGYSQE